jgi:hypothetical protein
MWHPTVMKIAARVYGLWELAQLSGLHVTTCGDIVRNTMKEDDLEWNDAYKKLRGNIMKDQKGRKSHGRRKRKRR